MQPRPIPTIGCYSEPASEEGLVRCKPAWTRCGPGAGLVAGLVTVEISTRVQWCHSVWLQPLVWGGPEEKPLGTWCVLETGALFSGLGLRLSGLSRPLCASGKGCMKSWASQGQAE